MLCRRRAQFDLVARALRARGIPVELVGLGGLLATPEVRDLVSTLQVVSDPTAGAALARLLTGARWRVGPRDLAALGRRARALAARAPRPSQAGRRRRGRPTPAWSRRWTTWARRRRTRPPATRGWPRSAPSWPRCAGAPPSRCPTWSPTSSARCCWTSRSPPPRAGSSAAGRAHLDRFADVAADFSVDAEVPTLGAFLAYLAAAEDVERGLEAGRVEVDTDAVQVLTVHAAKGLEWDVVAVPGLTAGVFPDRDAAGSSGWATSVRHPAVPAARRRRRPAGPRRVRPRGTRRAWTTRGRRSSRPAGSAGSGRSGGWRTWRSPGPGSGCCAPATGGTPR